MRATNVNPTFTQTDNRDHSSMESYYLDSIKALRAEVRRLTTENEILREQQRAFANRLSEVLKRQAAKTEIKEKL